MNAIHGCLKDSTVTYRHVIMRFEADSGFGRRVSWVGDAVLALIKHAVMNRIYHLKYSRFDFKFSLGGSDSILTQPTASSAVCRCGSFFRGVGCLA